MAWSPVIPHNPGGLIRLRVAQVLVPSDNSKMERRFWYVEVDLLKAPSGNNKESSANPLVKFIRAVSPAAVAKP